MSRVLDKESFAAHRVLVCQMCGELRAVLEVPAGHIDPARYVCLDCLKPAVTCSFCMTTDPDAYCGEQGCADVAIRAERREQRPAVPYGEFPEGY